MLKIGPGKRISISRWIDRKTPALDMASRKTLTCRADQKVSDVSTVFSKRFRRLPVAGKDGVLRGMLTAYDVLAFLYTGRRAPKGPKSGAKVKDIMTTCPNTIDSKATMEEALDIFKKKRKGGYPVVRKGKVEGILTESDIIRKIDGKTGVKVRDAMVRKPLVVQLHHTVDEVARMLVMGGFRRLPVVEKGELRGLVTTRDILGLKKGKTKSPVEDVMQKDVHAVDTELDVYGVIRVMKEKNIGGFPVLEEGRLAGIITERDIIDACEF